MEQGDCCVCQQNRTSHASKCEEVGREQRDHPARNGVSRIQIILAAVNDGTEGEPGPTRQCVLSEGCHHQDVRVWQCDPERHDHPRNTEEATVSMANDAPHSPRNGHKPSHWKTCGTEALVEQYGPVLGCERYHGSNEVNQSHEVARRHRTAVLLCHRSKCKRNQKQRTPPVAMETREELAHRLRSSDTIRQTLIPEMKSGNSCVSWEAQTSR